MVKGVTARSRQVRMREISANEPLTKHRKDSDDTKTGVSPVSSGEAWKIPTYYSCGVRCTGGMTLIRAFVQNLRTWAVMLKGKGTSGRPTRPKVPKNRQGALLRSSEEA